MKTFKLTYREHNRTQVLGTFSTQEELDRIIKAECELIQNESLMPLVDQEELIEKLLIWAKSQWNPNASKSMSYHYPDSRTVGYYNMEEV